MDLFMVEHNRNIVDIYIYNLSYRTREASRFIKNKNILPKISY